LGAKVPFAQLSERFGVDAKTVSAHHAKLKRWLWGVPELEPGLLPVAQKLFSERLVRVGLIEGKCL
jgi:hypothetical protein